MKKSVDIVVVIPVGPGTKTAFIIDTIASYIHYTKRSYQFILADDSHQGIGIQVKKNFPEVDIIHSEKPMGGWAGLYITLSLAFSFALDHYHFKALFKLDTDALIIGEEPEADALELFRQNPQIGIAGQYPFEYNGKPWNIGWPRSRILNGVSTWKYIHRPYANWFLRKLYIKAISNGYIAGESVFGGAYFMNELCLIKLREEGLLPDYKLKTLNLGEDHLFSLLAKAVGFDLGSLSHKGMPFACAWKGLPAAPDQLYDEGKKIIHSTRYWQDMNENEIRECFSKKRSESPLAI